MFRRRFQRPGKLAAVVLAATAIITLSGCSDSGDGPTGGEDAGTHSSGIPILRGEWPFDMSERCSGDGVEAGEKGPVCLVAGDGSARTRNAVAGVGSRFTSDVDVTITYRGGIVTRDATDDSANPERRFVAAFYDVTFPESQPNEDELLLMEFGPDGSLDVGFQLAFMGSNANSMSWPTGSGSSTGLYQPEPGETLTFAVAGLASGPTSLLGEDDPILTIDSGYSYDLGEAHREAGRAEFALLDQDPDSDVLDDVRASIEKVATRLSGGANGGMQGFENTFAEWLGGSPLESRNTLDGGDAPTSSDANDVAVQNDAGSIADGLAQEDPWEDAQGPFDESATDGGAKAPSGDGTYDQPQKVDDPWHAATAIADGLRTTSQPYYDCDLSTRDVPCARVLDETEEGGVELAVVALRFGAASEDQLFDLALRIGTEDPRRAGWSVLDEWYYAPDTTPPDWADYEAAARRG